MDRLIDEQAAIDAVRDRAVQICIKEEKTMSRVSEMKNSIEQENKNGGLDRDKWVIFMLTDIALSLARIVDALEGEDHETD